jgi:hypothetical protein
VRDGVADLVTDRAWLEEAGARDREQRPVSAGSAASASSMAATSAVRASAQAQHPLGRVGQRAAQLVLVRAQSSR